MACGHSTLLESPTCRGTNHDLRGLNLPQRVYRCLDCARDVWVGMPPDLTARMQELQPGGRKPIERPASPQGYASRPTPERGGRRKMHGTFAPGTTAPSATRYAVAWIPREQRPVKPWAGRGA